MNKNKRILKGLGFSSLFFMLAAPSFGINPSSIPVVGTDGQGRSIDEEVPETEYSEHLQAIVTTVNDSMTEALSKQNAVASWKLTSVVVGIGLSAEVGVGPIIKAKIAPRFRILFSKNNDAIAP